MFLKLCVLWLTVLQCQECRGVIYQLNDTLYNRMPPLFALDDYSRCLKPADGLYCVLQLELHGGNDSFIDVIREYSEFTTKHFNYTILDRGVCFKTLKKSCHYNPVNTTPGLEQTLEACLNQSIYEEYGLQAKLSKLFYCEKPNEETVIDTSDWIMAAVMGFVILMNVVGSLYDYILRKIATNGSSVEITGNPFLLSFSLFKSWKWLVYKSEEPTLDKLKGLHGVRTIGIVLVVFAHVILIYGGFIDNTHDFEQFYSTTYSQVVMNGGVIIQLFFVMTGMLLAIKMQVVTEKIALRWAMVPKIVFFRWLRLTPANALMIGVTATWLRHWGSGPLWRLAVTHSAARDCRDYWWHHLLYFNNYVGDRGKHCAVHTWYLAADMQLFVVGVLVLMLTRARGRVLALSVLVVLGVIAPALHVLLQDLGGGPAFIPEWVGMFTGARPGTNPTFYDLHITAHNNLSAFAVGMAAALLLNKWLNSGKRFSEHTKILRYIIYSIIPLELLLIYIGCVLFLADEEPSLVSRMAYQGLHRFIFSLLAAVGFMGFALKFEDKIRGVLEWDGWMVPSRLSYSVYILHIMFINVLIGTKTQLGHMTLFNVMKYHLSVTALSFLAALPFCLAVEAPMIALCSYAKSKGAHQTATKPEVKDATEKAFVPTISETPKSCKARFLKGQNGRKHSRE